MNKHLRKDPFTVLPDHERLFWYRWSAIKTLSYLNIIDYQGKIKPSETIPWNNIPHTEEEVHKFSQLTVCNAYKLFILDKLRAANNIIVPEIVDKLLQVCNLYSSVLDSDKKTFLYLDVIRIFYEKQFNDSASVRSLWTMLCGNSNKSKINVLNSLMERRRDRKSVDMLSYILNVAQTAKFNFWGVWFRENEEEYLYFCPTTLALLKGNLELLILLLQYGFEQNPDRIGIYDQYYYYLHHIVYSWLKVPVEERSLGRSAIVTEVLMFLVLISKVKSKSKFISLKKCFLLLWSVNAVPFVTKSELLDEIYLRFMSTSGQIHLGSFPCTYEHFIDLVEYYDLVKPQGATNEVTPRSLLQICKCAIRRTLARSYNLPQGIEKLGLPITLQAFLHV